MAIVMAAICHLPTTTVGTPKTTNRRRGIAGVLPEQRLFIALALALLLALSLVYKLIDAKLPRTFRSFQQLEFAEPGNCRLLSSASGQFNALQRIVTWEQERPSTAVCASQWFSAPANYLELEYAAYRPIEATAPLHFALQTKGIEGSLELIPAEGRRAGTWRLLGTPLTAKQASGPIRIVLVDKDPEAGWLALRTRVSFYSVAPWVLALRSWASEYPSLISWSLVSTLTLFLVLSLSRIKTNLEFLLLAFVVLFAIHYRFDLFYHADDFDFVSRYQKFGWRSIFYNHHEHLPALFAGFFLLQYYTFGIWFAGTHFISLLLQAVNAALLNRFMQRLGFSRLAAQSSTILFFASSWLLSAALQWATCQSILLSILFRLLAYHASLSYLQNRKIRSLWILAGSILAAGFSFGGGVSLGFEALALLLIFQPKAIMKNTRFLITLLLSTSVVFSTYVYNAYVLKQTQSRLVLSQFGELARYALYGAEYGTLARATGIDRLITNSSPVDSLPNDLWQILLYSSLSLGLLGVYCVVRPSKSAHEASALDESSTYWQVWLFGQLLMILPFVLTGLGRYQWGGVSYALSLRYYPLSLLGLGITLTPMLHLARRFLPLLALLLPFFFKMQLNQVSQERYYIDKGLLAKSYAEQLMHWDVLRHDTPGADNYEAIGTKLAGLYPIPYAGSPHDPIAFLPRTHPLELTSFFSAPGED